MTTFGDKEARLSTELRLFEVEEGLACAISDRGLTWAYERVILFWMFVGGAGSIVSGLALSQSGLVVGETAFLGVLFALLMGLVATIAVLRTCYRRIEFGPRGMRVSEQRRNQVQGMSHVAARSGANSRGILQQEEPEFYGYADLREVGHDDLALWWMTLNGVRKELVLDGMATRDIQRLHDELRSRWERARASLTDEEEEVAQRRATLSSFVS